jgi:hypothetical protein
MLWVCDLNSRDQRSRTEVMSGNIFAVRPGKKSGPPTYAGSHMDTQVDPPFFNGTWVDNYSLLAEGMTEFWEFMRVSKLSRP